MVYMVYETFDLNTIQCYVISMKNKQDRIDNINTQQTKIPNLKFEIVEAVNGNAMSDDEFKQLYDNGIVSKEKYDYAIATKHGKGQIGIYLSTLKVYDMIKNSSVRYSIIFEDDFQISDEFENQLNDIMDKVEVEDFDFIYLGNLSGNKDDNSIQYKDNIYYFNKENNLYGNHGYLINNSRINNIIENIKFIDRPIDNKIQDLTIENRFITLIVDPVIVDPGFPGSNGTSLNGFSNKK